MKNTCNFRKSVEMESQTGKGNQSLSAKKMDVRLTFRMKIFFVMLVMSTLSFSAFAAKEKTIYVSPDNAQISIGGSEVGTGKYKFVMTNKQDFVILKLSAEGYITKEVKIYKDDKTNSYNFQLEPDEAYLASSENVDVANKTMRAIVKKGMPKADAWQRLMFYISDNFDTFEINDNAAGWIRTAWAVKKFNGFTIRTRIEVKEVPGQNDEIVYRILLTSEWALNTCGLSDQCFSKWNRLLKKYDTMIKDIQSALN